MSSIATSSKRHHNQQDNYILITKTSTSQSSCNTNSRNDRFINCVQLITNNDGDDNGGNTKKEGLTFSGASSEHYNDKKCVGCSTGDNGVTNGVDSCDRDDFESAGDNSNSKYYSKGVAPVHRQMEWQQRRRLQQGDDNTILTIQTINPYVHTYKSYAKERWYGKSVLDVYCNEFGGYTKEYYEKAIQLGNIRLSGKVVDIHEKVQNGNILTHTICRHEPAIMIPFTPFLSSSSPLLTSPLSLVADLLVIKETEDIIAVNKPSTIPVHPTGIYDKQTLTKILEPKFGKLHTIHRLDRLTSGLVLFAKTSKTAQKYTKIMMNKDLKKNSNSCSKMYLARVKGKFPYDFPRNDLPRKYLNGSNETTSATISDGRLPYGYWISDLDEHEQNRMTIDSFCKKSYGGNDKNTDNINKWLQHLNYQGISRNQKNTKSGATSNSINKDGESISPPQFYWLHVLLPCRVVSNKLGVCETDTTFQHLNDEEYSKTVKTAHTSFTTLKYFKEDNTTLILCKPYTGRSHQIRLHLQYINHPIPNDPKYSCFLGHSIKSTVKFLNATVNDTSTIWFGNTVGNRMAKIAQLQLDDIIATSSRRHDENDSSYSKNKALTAEKEASNKNHGKDSDINSHDVQRTCTLCIEERQLQTLLSTFKSISEKKVDKRSLSSSPRIVVVGEITSNSNFLSILEFLTQSRCLWLHALQYNFNGIIDTTMNNTLDERSNNSTIGGSISFDAPLPPWSKF